MQGLKELLLQEKKHLENIITKASADRENSPDGRLRISVDSGKLRYYHCLDDRYGVYIPRENDKLPRGLAQKAYEESVIKAAEKRLKSIDRCLRGMDVIVFEHLKVDIPQPRNIACKILAAYSIDNKHNVTAPLVCTGYPYGLVIRNAVFVFGNEQCPFTVSDPERNDPAVFHNVVAEV